MSEKTRCAWSQYAGGDTQIYIDYHDNEWGKPVHYDNKLFELLILEGMQAVGMVNDHTTDCFVYRELGGVK